MATDPDLNAVLGAPFREQVAALRLRFADLRDTAAWDDLWQAEHDRAFVVAGATKADVLADLAQAVDRAIAEGRGLEWFRTEFRRIVEARGWHGWTGEGTAKGEAWRTRVIWETNVATSFAAGRRAQLLKGNFKFWVYKHGDSRHPRLHHLALDGVALPPDHPFWATHSPPNGWGCKCYVVGANTAAGVRRVGGDPDKALPAGWDRIDPRTAAPVGIDRGWAYAPGATAADTVQALVPKLDLLPEQPSVALIQDWLRLPAFEAWRQAPAGVWPLARLPEADALAIGAEVRIAVMSADTMVKQQDRHPELTVADYSMVQLAVRAAQHRFNDVDPRYGNRSRLFVYDATEGGYVVVVRATRTGQGLFIQSVRRLSRDQAERDATIARLLRKGEPKDD
jgi:hypothetical protein